MSAPLGEVYTSMIHLRRAECPASQTGFRSKTSRTRNGVVPQGVNDGVGQDFVPFLVRVKLVGRSDRQRRREIDPNMGRGKPRKETPLEPRTALLIGCA